MARNACYLAVRGLAAAAALLAAATTAGCTGSGSEPALSKQAEPDQDVKLPPVPANGPKLGALADVTPVLDQPKVGAKQIGYLHAGAKVTRTAEAFGQDGCGGGWYPIRPRGVVCAGQIATTKLSGEPVNLL